MIIKIAAIMSVLFLILLGALGDCNCDTPLEPSEVTANITFEPEHNNGDSISFAERVVSLHVRLNGLGTSDSENWVRIRHNDFVYKIDPFSPNLDNADGSIIQGWVSFDYRMTCLHGENTFILDVLTPEGNVVATSNTVSLNGDWDASDNPLHLRLTWDTDSSDFDFHCLTPNGSEVWYQNMFADGVRLDVDDVDGYGPENITVEVPLYGDPGYRYFVRYYDAHGITVDTTVTVEVYVNETKDKTYTHVYSPSEANYDDPSNDWYLPDNPFVIPAP